MRKVHLMESKVENGLRAAFVQLSSSNEAQSAITTFHEMPALCVLAVWPKRRLGEHAPWQAQ